MAAVYGQGDHQGKGSLINYAAFYIAFAMSFIPAGFRSSDEGAQDRNESESPATSQFEQDRSPKEERPSEAPSISGSGSASLAPGEISIHRLLDNSSVQEELGLSDEQLETLRSIYMSRVRDPDYQNLVRRWRSTQGEERAALQREMTSYQDQLGRAMVEVLDTDQRDRLLQIAIQNGGIQALKLPVVLDRLYLRPGQRERILGILAAKEANEAELFRQLKERIASVNKGPLSREARLSLINDQLKERHERAVQHNHASAVRALSRTLSRGQKRRFEAMAGEPFDVTALRSDHRVHRGPPPETPATDEADTDEPRSKPEIEADDSTR